MRFSPRRTARGAAIALAAALALLQGCASVHTFPKVARAGDTVTLMIGGSEKARAETIDVTLTDANGTTWDLRSLGLVRSIFNLRAEGRAEGKHYATFNEKRLAWNENHEPIQTVLVTDLPDSLPIGDATLTINTNVDDDASNIGQPFEVSLEIISGPGQPDGFEFRGPIGTRSLDFTRFEPAPHAKLTFGTTADVIGAASFVVDFDETVVDPEDLNVYVPQSAQRGSATSEGSFGGKQRMVYWRQDGDRLFIDTVAPQGIAGRYLMYYIVHPGSVGTNPQFTLVSADVYDIDGNITSLTPTLQYFP